MPKAKIGGYARRGFPAVRRTPARATWVAPAWTSTPPATCTSAWVTTCRRTPRATAATRRWTTAPPSAGTPARRRPTRADLRGKVLRITPTLGDIASGRDARASASTYVDPGRATCSRSGTAKTRPEIYTMGFRQPFTRAHRPEEPGHRSASASTATTRPPTAPAARRPARASGTWSTRPGNFGWPFCVGDQSPANTMTRWNYAANATTGQKYDCSPDADPVRHQLRAGGPDARSRRRSRAWTRSRSRCRRRSGRSTPNAGNTGMQSDADFGNLTAGGMQPVSGPIYRYNGGDGRLGRLPGVLRRLVADQQPRLERRLLEGSPAAPRQQQDAARAGLAAVQPRRQRDRPAEQPGDRHAVRRGRRALHGPLSRHLLPQQRQRRRPRAQIVKITFDVYEETAAPTTTVDARPGHAGRRPHVLGPGHGEVHVDRRGRAPIRRCRWRASTTPSTA